MTDNDFFDAWRAAWLADLAAAGTTPAQVLYERQRAAEGRER